jgi:hypothetical protein
MKYDRDRSGKIECKEFPKLIIDFFKMINVSSPTPTQCQRILAAFDLDHDGGLCYSEFKGLLNSLATSGKK